MKKRLLVSGIAAFLAAASSLNSLPASAAFVPYKDNWSAINSSDYMGTGYYFDEQDKKELFSKLKNTEKYDANLFGSKSGFIGSCYGFATTSLLASHGLIDNYADYQSPESTVQATCLAELDADIRENENYELSDRAKSLINYYQYTQFCDSIRQYCAHQVYDKTEEERIQLLLNMLEDDSPVFIAYSAYSDDTQTEQYIHHANVAYGVEDNGIYGYNWGKQHFDIKILVYEVNVSFISDESLQTGYNMTTAIYVNTEDWSWYLPLRNIGSATGARLDVVIEDVNLLNCIGLLDGAEPYQTDEPFLGAFVTNHLASAHTFKNMDESKQENSQKYMETPAFYIDGGDSAEVNFLTPDIQDGYFFDIDQPQELDTAMYYENSLQAAYAENGTQVAVDPSGFTGIEGNTGKYKLEMVFNEGYYSGSWHTISVSGSASEANIQKTEEGYLLTADNLKNVTVKVKNDVDTSLLAFSSEADSILLTENSEGILSAESVADSLQLGDLDNQLKVDAQDAAMILTASVNAASGNDSGLTATQEYAADINSDGRFNAADAALILQYSTAVGSGKFSGTLTEFLFLKN